MLDFGNIFVGVLNLGFEEMASMRRLRIGSRDKTENFEKQCGVGKEMPREV